MRLIMAFTSLCLSVLSIGQVRSNVVDKGDPNIQRVLRQQKRIFESGFPSFETYHLPRRDPSRFEIAVSIFANVMNVENSLERITDDKTSPKQRQILLTQCCGAYESITDFRRAAMLFEYELAELEVDMKGFYAKIDGLVVELTSLFVMKDVPVGHWAAASVARLNELEILVGYPDGRLRG